MKKLVGSIFLSFALAWASGFLPSSDSHHWGEVYAQAVSVNVRVFGARGDGITNDTAAFTNAEAALSAAGGTIVIPPGTYLITNWAPNHNDLVIAGSGRWA